MFTAVVVAEAVWSVSILTVSNLLLLLLLPPPPCMTRAVHASSLYPDSRLWPERSVPTNQSAPCRRRSVCPHCGLVLPLRGNGTPGHPPPMARRYKAVRRVSSPVENRQSVSPSLIQLHDLTRM